MNPRVSVIKCSSYDPDAVFGSVKNALNLLGGMAAFARPGSKVLVKPNLLIAKAPEYGITTHPEVVRAVVRLLKEINCSISIGDGPCVWGRCFENMGYVYEETGMKRIADEEGVELVKFDKRKWHGKFPLASCLDDCDTLISIPKFKTHELTILTGAIKNLFGLVSGTYKTELHMRYANIEDFARILVDIYEKTKPALTVVDGIVAMEGDGPGTGGELKKADVLVAGADCVAIDTILAAIMGIGPAEVLTNKEAAKRGLGSAKVSDIEILGDRLENVTGSPFKLPGSSFKRKLPEPIVKIARGLIRFFPVFQPAKCTKCCACIEACPAHALSMQDKRIAVDYSKCISCFCCQEACPASAIKVKKSLLARLLGL